jgi:sugar fermentation stimulation protein A
MDVSDNTTNPNHSCVHDQDPLVSLDELIEGIIITRPSKHCKTPYVADVKILSTNEEVIAHAPSLGCCGYADKGQIVYMTKHKKPNTCTHVIQLAHRVEADKDMSYLVGIHPKIAETIVHQCLTRGILPNLNNLSNVIPEQKYLNSRFDFCGKDENGNEFVLEVKNVPCADYEDIFAKERKKRDYTSYAYDSKVAYFPDGYRKSKPETISPRALKHIQELTKLKQTVENIRTIIVFVIQRIDCLCFQGSNIDPIYKNALNYAHDQGVEILPIQVCWDFEGKCYYEKTIPFKH